MSEAGMQAVIVGRGLELKTPAPPTLTREGPAPAAAPPAAAPAPAASPPAPRVVGSSEPEGFAATVLAPEAAPKPAEPAQPAAQPHAATDTRAVELQASIERTAQLMDQIVQRMERPAGEPKPETPDERAAAFERIVEENPEMAPLIEDYRRQSAELAALKKGFHDSTARAEAAAVNDFLYEGLTNLKAVYPQLTEAEGRTVAAWFADPKHHELRRVLSFREIAGRALGNDVLESRRFTAGSPAPPNGAKPVPAASPARVVDHSVPGAGPNGAAPNHPPATIRDAVAVVLRDHAHELGRNT